MTWEKDGEPFDLRLYPNVTYLNGELVLHEANEEVSGNYSCVATNFLGNETSEPTNVIVICKFVLYAICMFLKFFFTHFHR